MLESPYRRKPLQRRWAFLPLAVAVGAAIVGWGWSQPEPLVAAFMLSTVLGFLITLRLGRYAFGLIFSDEISWDRFPFENWLPVKGRWLRLLIIGPLAIVYLGTFWAAVSLLIGFAFVCFLLVGRFLLGG